MCVPITLYINDLGVISKQIHLLVQYLHYCCRSRRDYICTILHLLITVTLSKNELSICTITISQALENALLSSRRYVSVYTQSQFIILIKHLVSS
jgi:hypothetical protein